jgi:hypothetical protein
MFESIRNRPGRAHGLADAVLLGGLALLGLLAATLLLEVAPVRAAPATPAAVHAPLAR